MWQNGGKLVLVVSFGILLSVRAAFAQEDPRIAYTDPAAAPTDFKIQGEYLGKVQMDMPTPFGVQIVALGGGKFLAVGYFGGLPGEEWRQASVEAEGRLEGEIVEFPDPQGEGKGIWKNGGLPGEEWRQASVEAEGRLEGEIVEFPDPQGEGKGIWKNGELIIQNSAGEEIGRLAKIERKSPTLGQKPPEGAIVLFDGTSLDEWEKGRMTPDGLLMEGAVSKRRFRDFFIHIEFCTPFQPYARGQARGNSGFYAQGRYEVQILDSFGLLPQKNDCGAIYGVAAPRVNMCLPPLSWQTYDIEFRAARFDENGKKIENARMTVRHNGVLIHDNVEIPGPTRAALIATESPEPGPVYLQDHGNPVRFRNIWVIERN